MTSLSNPSTTPTASSASPRPARDAGVDLVRSIALIRVITFHASGNFNVLTALPAMPIMFFLGGTFVQRSLDRRSNAQVVVSRIRRVAYPAALHVALVFAALTLLGHRPSEVLSSLGESLLPRNGGAGTTDSVADWLFSTLWYLRDYIALVVISPLLVRIVRAWPTSTLLAIGALLAVGAASGVADATAMYLGFWLLGMSQQLPVWVAAANRRLLAAACVVAAVLGGAVVIAVTAPWGSPAGATLAGLGWLAGIELFRGDLDRVAGRRMLHRGVSWMMDRAVSIYLWQMVPVVVCFRLIGTDDRSLADVADALWVIPVVLIVTMMLATVFEPVERWASRR